MLNGIEIGACGRLLKDSRCLFARAGWENHWDYPRGIAICLVWVQIDIEYCLVGEDVDAKPKLIF